MRRDDEVRYVPREHDSHIGSRFFYSLSSETENRSDMPERFSH